MWGESPSTIFHALPRIILQLKKKKKGYPIVRSRELMKGNQMSPQCRCSACLSVPTVSAHRSSQFRAKSTDILGWQLLDSLPVSPLLRENIGSLNKASFCWKHTLSEIEGDWSCPFISGLV